jgi:hypothetical protein
MAKSDRRSDRTGCPSRPNGLPKPTVAPSSSPARPGLDANVTHQDGRTSTGFQAGVLIGPLLAVLIAIGLFIVLFLYLRRRERSLAMSAEGNELSFETEMTTGRGEISYEHEFSGTGSQYANSERFQRLRRGRHRGLRRQ